MHNQAVFVRHLCSLIICIVAGGVLGYAQQVTKCCNHSGFIEVMDASNQLMYTIEGTAHLYSDGICLLKLRCYVTKCACTYAPYMTRSVLQLCMCASGQSGLYNSTGFSIPVKVFEPQVLLHLGVICDSSMPGTSAI